MRYLTVTLLITLTLLLSGCETFHGIGKDLQNTGEWIQEKSR